MEKLTVLDNLERIDELLAYINRHDYVAFDCETTGVGTNAEVIGISVACDEITAYYLILAKWDTNTQALAYLNTRDAMPRILAALSKKNLVCHNGQFDCAKIERNFKVSLIDSLHTDTMILAHLLDERRRVGLKELGIALFGDSATDEQAAMKQSIVDRGGYATKTNYELYKADPYLIGKYGAKDALLTYRLFEELVPKLFEQKLNRFFYEEESMPLLRGPTYELNTTGIRVDVQALQALRKTLEVECEEAKAFIYNEIRKYISEKYPGTDKKNTFNIGSNVQMSWLLFGQMGLEFHTLTNEGKVVCRALGLKIPYSYSGKRDFIQMCLNNSGEFYEEPVKTATGTSRGKKIKEPWAYIACDKEALKKHSGSFKWISELLEYQRKQKLLSTYVEGIESRMEYGVIHPSFLQHGTTSGRYSSRDPNYQNLPRDDKRIKACMISRPGKIFVGADYSQLEPRVFAYVSNDEKLLSAFRSSEDFYSTIGMQVFNKYDCVPQKEGEDAFGQKYKKLRDLSKVIALATVYGATPFQLSKTTGKSPEDTEEIIKGYLENFPGVAQMMKDSHEMVKEHGQVVNMFGRPRRLPEAQMIRELYGNVEHDELPYTARQMLNLATNHRIQSTAASIVNRSAIAFHESVKLAGIDAKIVCQVHDSLIIECPEEHGELVAKLLRIAMEDTVKLDTIKLEAIPKIGHNFSEV